MKNFLAIFTGSPLSANAKQWEQMDPVERKQRESAGIKAWGEWVQKNQSAIVQIGSPIGKTKQVNADGVLDIKNVISAYTVVKAESHAAAAQLFVNHPHFMIFPGETVEVMECLPIPEVKV